jgi:hypothetical protein
MTKGHWGHEFKQRVRDGLITPQEALAQLQALDPGLNTTPKENATVRWLLRKIEEGRR